MLCAGGDYEVVGQQIHRQDQSLLYHWVFWEHAQANFELHIEGEQPDVQNNYRFPGDLWILNSFELSFNILLEEVTGIPVVNLNKFYHILFEELTGIPVVNLNYLSVLYSKKSPGSRWLFCSYPTRTTHRDPGG